MNMNNFGVLKGRLVADSVTFKNSDGSTKVKFSLACENNYKNRDGKRDAQIIPVEAYVKSDYEKSPYARIGKGDKISAEISLRQNNYTDKKTNEPVYSTVIFVEGIQFEESVAVTTARHAANAAQATADAAQAAAPAVAPAPVPAQV